MQLLMNTVRQMPRNWHASPGAEPEAAVIEECVMAQALEQLASGGRLRYDRLAGGRLASRGARDRRLGLADHYYRPVLVFSFEDGMAKGSARSILRSIFIIASGMRRSAGAIRRHRSRRLGLAATGSEPCRPGLRGLWQRRLSRMISCA